MQWIPDIQKWYEIDVEAYKIIYAEGKERYEDIMSESESITNKSIKMLTLAVPVASFNLSLILNIRASLCVESLMILLICVLFAVIIKLIFPKEIRNRGFAPKSTFMKQLDDPEDKEFQQQLVFYNLICMIQTNTTFMVTKNKERTAYYIAAICILSIMAISTICLSIYSYLPPLVERLPSSV